MTRPAGMAVLEASFAHALRMFREERLAEAEAVCRSLLRLAPGEAEVTHLLAAIGCRTGRMPDALAMARRAVAQEVQRGLFLNTLGIALRGEGRAEDALAWFGRALRLDPAAPEPRLNLGGLLADRRDAGAGREMRRALVLAPEAGEAHNNLGAMHMRGGDLAPAMVRFRRALATRPRMVDAWRNLSGAASWYGAVGRGLRAARTALALAPADAEAADMLANALVALGDAAAAATPLRRAVAIRPDFHVAASNLLFVLAYDGAVGADRIAAAQRRWARGLAVSTPAFANDRDPGRRLRLGYLSGDFRVHPVAWNVAGLIRNHDRDRFEVLLYSTTAYADATTGAFAAMADRFRDLAGVGRGRIGRVIRDDGIDVLVALAPHTSENPAEALVEKPAPVVVAFHAVGSTGLTTVDHWVTDDILHPVGGTTEPFTESLLRLPCFYLHEPPAAAPEPGPPPSEATGRVTFGSFNNPAKITPAVVALWSRVLAAVPGSRLLLRNGRRFGDPAVAGRFRSLFAAHGIGEDRLILEGAQLPRPEHLASFARVDVSLDPFPFNGSTTTFESLWMGVPVVTRVGDRFVGRVGLDLLSRIGLADLAAGDDESYVATAAALAADAPRRRMLRGQLRARLTASPLCRPEAYARSFEAAIRGTWRSWCLAS